MERVELAVRIDPDNPNHHLWNNHGTWWIHYTVYPNAWSAERIRRSLGTKNLDEARRRRARRRRDRHLAVLGASKASFRVPICTSPFPLRRLK